jgi:phage terminase large subunit
MRLRTTVVYDELDTAVGKGYTVISEQGGARSGKTYNTVLFLVMRLLACPGTLLSIVRKTLPALKGSVYRDFEAIMRSLSLWDPKAYNKSEMIYRYTNGSEVEFFSTDNEQKLRGRKRDILFVNEANEVSFMEWKQLKMRTTTLSILDYNPSFGDDHWLCQLNADHGTYHFTTTYRDNPFLEQNIIDEIESYRSLNPSLWRVYGAGLQAVIEGAVYPEYDIVDDIPKSARRRWGAIDFGFTNDPTAILEVAVDGKDFYIDEIAYQTGMVSGDIISVCRQSLGRHKIICESADPRLVEELYRSGLNVHAVRKFKGSVEAGISKAHEYRLKVTRRSVNVIKELKNYTYQQDRGGRWLNTPIDAYNHACDAFRYVIMEELMSGTKRPIDLSVVEDMAY